LKEILIFAGTTEGRKLSEYLAAAGIKHTACVATEYGEIVLNRHPLVEAHRGRMGREEIREFLAGGRFCAVVDATHPYAKDVTRHIKAAIEELAQRGEAVSYLRLKRDITAERKENIFCFETQEACAEALENTEGNILLTTGSKELPIYCASERIKDRLYVRVLPGPESLSLCMEQGICGKRIIAMQGPFSVEMNEAIIRQYKISVLVTKESGIAGGYPEKRKAAERTGIQVFVVGRPEEEGDSFAGVCGKLEAICGKKIRTEDKLEIILAGVGMGHEGCLTKEVEKAIREADVLIGAKRILGHILSGAEKYPFYQAEQIISCLHDVQKKNLFMEHKKAVILFSGDSGFYSGCEPVSKALEKEIREGRLRASMRIMPGISSVAYLASRIGESYQDAAIYSLHGKAACNLINRIKNAPKVFLLTSGVRDINRLGRALLEADMPGCEVITGYQLSCEEQRVERLTPAECCQLTEEGLYTCLVKNPGAEERKATHGIKDEAFIRDRVPMTKEEIRDVGICKLRLREKSVVYDIGSGTGSVAVEIAALSDDIRVYAVERKEEAVSLIRKNREKFGLQNIEVVKGVAPEGLWELPAATHAFIGGSGGRLREILETLRQINPGMRVVAHAASLETLGEMKNIMSTYRVHEDEIIQMQVNRVRKAGKYNMVQAENPVWICAFTFCGGEAEINGSPPFVINCLKCRADKRESE